MSLSWSSRPYDLWDDLRPAPAKTPAGCPPGCTVCAWLADAAEQQRYQAWEDARFMEEERERYEDSD